jgi:hypothetical protein
MAAYCDSQREVFSLSEKEAWSRPPQRDLDDAPELHGDSTGRVLGVHRAAQFVAMSKDLEFSSN